MVREPSGGSNDAGAPDNIDEGTIVRWAPERWGRDL